MVGHTAASCLTQSLRQPRSAVPLAQSLTRRFSLTSPSDASAQELEVAAIYVPGDGDKVDRASRCLSGKAASFAISSRVISCNDD